MALSNLLVPPCIPWQGAKYAEFLAERGAPLGALRALGLNSSATYGAVLRGLPEEAGVRLEFWRSSQGESHSFCPLVVGCTENFLKAPTALAMSLDFWRSSQGKRQKQASVLVGVWEEEVVRVCPLRWASG